MDANDDGAQTFFSTLLEELGQVIDGSFACTLLQEDGQECGFGLADLQPAEIALECRFCGHGERMHWQEADDTCGQCPGGPVMHALLVSGAFSTRMDRATDFFETPINAGWSDTRPDYWEYIVHFTNADAFARILGSGQLVASPTGYFNRPAVCFTEVPPPWHVRFTASFTRMLGTSFTAFWLMF